MKKIKKLGVIASVVLLIAFVFIEGQKLLEEYYPNMEATTQTAFYEFPHNKLWAHKVYSFKEADTVFQEYSGLETDVIFDTTREVFDLRHNEGDSFLNKSLDEFFSNIKNVSNYYYWIDFKNLNNTTCEKSMKRMNYLLDKHQLRDKVIVESWNSKELGKFSKASIGTSYWIPHFEYDSLTIINHQSEIRSIRRKLDKYSLNALSADYKMYPFLERYFSDCNVHLWTNGLINDGDKSIIVDLHKEDNVKVILVDYKKNFIRNSNVGIKY